MVVEELDAGATVAQALERTNVWLEEVMKRKPQERELYREAVRMYRREMHEGLARQTTSSMVEAVA